MSVCNVICHSRILDRENKTWISAEYSNARRSDIKSFSGPVKNRVKYLNQLAGKQIGGHKHLSYHDPPINQLKRSLHRLVSKQLLCYQCPR